MPPYLRAGRAVGLREFLEQPPHLLLGHADAGVGHGNRDPVAAIGVLPARGDGDGAFLGELVGVARQVEQRLPEAGLVGVDRAEVRRAIDDDAIGVLRRHRLDRLGHVLDQRRQRERFEVKLHAPRLDLRQVENVVDQGEQVAGGAQHPLERLELVLALEIAGVLQQHLGDADDGVERRAQLVAHAGEELRLVLAGDLELLALLLDLVEQPRVLDRDHRLRGEGLQQIDRAFRKLARLFAADHQRADNPIGTEQGHDQQRAEAGADDDIEDWRFRLGLHVGNLNRHTLERQPGQIAASSNANVTILDLGSDLLVHSVGRAQPEFPARIVERVDRARLGPGERSRLGDDRRQHGLQVDRGVDRLADLAERAQLADRLREVVGAGCAAR